MPPRKKPTRRKKSSSATTPTPTPTPVDDHNSTTPEVETGAEVADVAIVKWDEMLKPVEASISNHAKIDADSTTSNHAKIDGDSTTSVVISPESMIKEEGVLENSAAGDVNEARNEGGNKVTEDLGLKSEDIDKGKQGVENDESDETVDKEKEDSYHGSENVDQHKQGSGIDAGDNEEEKQENTEVILASTQESNADKAPCNNDAALVVEDSGNGDRKGNSEIVSPEDSVEAVTTKTSSENNIAMLFEDDGESDDGSEEDDADNEGDEDPCEDPVSVNKKDKDIEIYVGGLHKNTVEDDLVNVFQQFGELKSTRIVRNSTTKKSKGFAFVRFVSPDQAKRALSELKDGVEVRGKRVKISESQDNHTLYLGNISKTWKKEEVLQQLKQYGIEHIEMIRLPEKLKTEGKNKGFAFLEFNTHSDAVAAFQRLQKPDAVFGRDISAKVAFAQAALHQNDEVLSQAKRVYLEGLTKEWNEEKVKEICGKYGEIVKFELCKNPRTKNKDFGFITFTSNENALACVEGINNAGTRGEVKIKANFAKSHPKSKEGVRGGFKVEASTSNKKGEISKETSEPKLRKIKGGLNSQQLKRNKKDTSKNKAQVHQQKGIIKNGERSRKAELTDKKSDLDSQQRKRKASSKQNLNPPPNLRHDDQGTPKKPKFGGEGQNSKSASKPGSHKRKALKYEGREDGGSRNPHSKKPLKKLKGNIHGRERDNYRNTNSDSHIRRGHDDYRNSTRYTDPYAPAYAASSVYHLAPDLLSTRRFKEMEPHAGYIEPASATHSRSYSGYVQPVVRPHNPHQTVYLSPGAGSQSQSQPHSRYSDRSFITQTHRGYIETAVVPEVQPYRGYQQSSFVQIARDPYDSGLSRTVRHDGRGTAVTYVGGRPLPSSQVRNYTSYYQGGGSYNASSSSQRTYY